MRVRLLPFTMGLVAPFAFSFLLVAPFLLVWNSLFSRRCCVSASLPDTGTWHA